MKFNYCPILLGLLFTASPALAETVVFDEATDGELSDLALAPTSLGSLSLGVNTIQGSLAGLGANGGGGATNGNDADVFTFSLAPGLFVTDIVTSRTAGGVGFVGYANANALANAVSSNATLSSAVEAGGLFGNGSIGGGVGGLAAIPTSLGAGDHTFFLQETVTPTEFTISFTVAAVPEPTSAVLVGGLSLLGFARRRKS